MISTLGILFHLSMSKRDSFSSVESVKAASDAFCPASGKVVEVNTVFVFVFLLIIRLFLRLLLL